MRDANVFSFKRALPRMSWSPQNLYNLWARTAGPKAQDIEFKQTNKTLFQQRWRSKAVVRAYHGDYINEKIFKRWYLPETLPDVRPRKQFGKGTGDLASLEEFAKRKQKQKDYEQEEEVRGSAPVGSLMFSEIERRIDVFIFRCCFVHSVYEARRLVIHGDVMLNGKKHQNANTRLAPGDMVSVNPDSIRFFKPRQPSHDDVNGYEEKKKLAEKAGEEAGEEFNLTPFYLPPFASPWLFIPSYIEASFKTCSAIYVRHPTARPGYSEIPTPYDADGEVVRFAWEWYTERRPRLRSPSQLSRMPEDRVLV
ncbi:hypothetical protein APHAL10511_000203 [Amanita phalloides]|nr:hypothetical protein APHAL10511_000203 [Amanita phalloides]